jgi:putative transferase (TIGR04331 family)
MIDSQFRVAMEVEAAMIGSLSAEIGTDVLDVRDREFLISVWAHFFSHSALAVWFSKDTATLSDYQNYSNIPADTYAFMVLNRTNEYIDYLSSSHSHDNAEVSLKVEKRVGIIDVGKLGTPLVLLYKPGFSKKFRLHLRIASLGKIKSYSRLIKLSLPPIDQEKRNQIKEIVALRLAVYPFARWLAARAAEFLPAIFLEDFPRVADIYRGYESRIERIFSRDCWATDDALKIFSAVLKSRKPISMVGAPHALNYGSLKHFWLRDYELDYLDEYLSWGWKYGNVLPFFNPQFSGKRRPVQPKKLNANFEILVSGASRPSYLIEYPYSVEKFHLYLKNQILLADELAKKTCLPVTIRTRKRGLGQELEKMIQTFGTMSFKWEYQGVEFLKRIYNCLHLCDNTSTALVESLWLNQPTILLIESGYFEIWENALDDFGLLSKVGIFHTSRKSVIEFIMDHRYTINEWWNAPETQQAAKLFLEKQGRPDGSIRDWKNILLGSLK